MAKPSQTYTWGESADLVSVGNYEDTGWPDDNIPPQRKQFNWYQNLVGQWIGWLEEQADDYVNRIKDNFFSEIDVGTVSNVGGFIAGIPYRNGIHVISGSTSAGLRKYLVMVAGDDAVMIRMGGSSHTVISARRSGSTFVQGQWSFGRTNSGSDIASNPSELAYATPKAVNEYVNEYVLDLSTLSRGIALATATKEGDVPVLADANMLRDKRVSSGREVNVFSARVNLLEDINDNPTWVKTQVSLPIGNAYDVDFVGASVRVGHGDTVVVGNASVYVDFVQNPSNTLVYAIIDRDANMPDIKGVFLNVVMSRQL